MNVFEEIFARDELQSSPAVLIDVGAAGELPKKWRSIAKHCVCIAFDGDSREMSYITRESKVYKKLIVFPRVVVESSETEIDFHLTDSPVCSSRLYPRYEDLGDWVFQSFFRVKQTVRLRAIHIRDALDQVGVDRVDWFKTDSQGTDLRLFISLGENLISKLLMVEFEPGFIDSYVGEDKIYDVLKALEQRNFWLSAFNVKGVQRLCPQTFAKYFSKLEQQVLNVLIDKSPVWAEMTYTRKLSSPFTVSKRNLFLLWVFSMIEKQYGFCLEVAELGEEKFADPLFSKMKSKTLLRVRLNLWRVFGKSFRVLAGRLGQFFWRKN